MPSEALRERTINRWIQKIRLHAERAAPREEFKMNLCNDGELFTGLSVPHLLK